MEKTKCALLDTDFISKLHITRKDDDTQDNTQVNTKVNDWIICTYILIKW